MFRRAECGVFVNIKAKKTLLKIIDKSKSTIQAFTVCKYDPLFIAPIHLEGSILCNDLPDCEGSHSPLPRTGSSPESTCASVEIKKNKKT